ncbi:tigger transposable element-derived protein 6-like [Uloborus diversus]|uniref:tigger transposable element-derived protein 6-like n=1 Tax=Uloborus diversus TaxID=327109 RepID=UPI0024097E54|nr:tigger transposable element-derived protein 6-like [Uloborus diversus]
MKSAEHEKLEDALYTWIMQMTAKNATIIREHAKIFGQQMNITDFEYSNGWLNRFKKRRGLSQHIRSGETANVDPTIVTKGREKLRAIISQYAVADVYNMDESGLFYRLQPDKTLSNGAVKGCKKAKDRVSLVFCTNVDGSDTRTVSVIGKAAKPRCFKNFNPALYVDYDSNRKAWMTAILFQKWLKSFNDEMKRKKRHILLIIDNAPCHKSTAMSNIRIEFLPPDCTGVLQPLDAGIIKSFKAHYRKYHVRHIVERIKNNVFSLISLKEAIHFIKKAWDEVTPDTILNCWRHTGLVDGEKRSVQNHVEMQEIQDSIDKLTVLEHPLTANEFIDADKSASTFEDMTHEDIIELAAPDSNSDLSEEETIEHENENINSEVAKDCLQKLRRFLDKNASDRKMMNNLLALEKDIETVILNKKSLLSAHVRYGIGKRPAKTSQSE